MPNCLLNYTLIFTINYNLVLQMHDLIYVELCTLLIHILEKQTFYSNFLPSSLLNYNLVTIRSTNTLSVRIAYQITLRYFIKIKNLLHVQTICQIIYQTTIQYQLKNKFVQQAVCGIECGIVYQTTSR